MRGGACQNAVGPVAQWLEQATHNRSVVGSIPARPTSRMLVVVLVSSQERRRSMVKVLLSSRGCSVEARV